jgi:multidrug resistance efflux pump
LLSSEATDARADAKLPVQPSRPVRLVRELVDPPVASEPTEPLPQVEKPTWALLALLAGATLTLLALAVFTKIEVVATAHGSLISGTGATPIFAQRAGPVRKLSVQAGDLVVRGQSIAQVAVADLEARADKTEKQLSNLRTQDEEVRQTAARLHQQTLDALGAKGALLAQRVQLTRKRVAALEHRARQVQTLTAEGVESQSALLIARESVSAAQEQLFALQQEIADVDIRVAERQYDFVHSQLTRNLEIRAAELESNEAESLTGTGHARAPDPGRVESVLVTEGQVVAAGELLALIVREDEPPSVVAFVEDDDAAFLREGLRATLEFSSLPEGEFGKASARVTRVGTGAAAAAEIAKATSHAFAPGEALVRVELRIDEDAAWKKMRSHVRSGSGVKARLETRQRRLIALALNTWNQWLAE